MYAIYAKQAFIIQADVVLTTDKGRFTFPCHKILLVARGNAFFGNMFRSGMKEAGNCVGSGDGFI